jgi:cardiolipin synthase
MSSGIAHRIRSAIPNILTFFRLLAVPAVGYFIHHHLLTQAFALYTAASVTDWFDGYLARRWNVQSAFGRLWDPIADKLLVIVTYVMLGFQDFIPLWLVALVFTRDALLLCAGLFILYLKKPIDLEPSFISKVNTFFQMMLVGSVFTTYFTKESGFYPGIFEALVVGFIYAAAITTLLSGIGYALRVKRQWHLK